MDRNIFIPLRGGALLVRDIIPWAGVNKWNCQQSPAFEPNLAINGKVALVRCDISKLSVDAIVNAAKENLLGGAGVDGAIHAAAGPQLREYCKLIPLVNDMRCAPGPLMYYTIRHQCPGHCKVTSTVKCQLNARYVFHTVGPRREDKHVLQDCYKNCFKSMLEHKLRTIAFPCIGTGVFGYKNNNKSAAKIALNIIRRWLDLNHNTIDLVVICTYLQEDFDF